MAKSAMRHLIGYESNLCIGFEDQVADVECPYEECKDSIDDDTLIH